MQSLRYALLPGAIAGLLSVLMSWIWMGVVFHRFQEDTPETWREEGSRSYAISSVIRFLASIAMATVVLLVAHPATSPFSRGIEHALAFAVAIWIALAAPIIIEAAIYIRLHPLVVVAQLLDWLTTLLLASGITAWWRDT